MECNRLYLSRPLPRPFPKAAEFQPHSCLRPHCAGAFCLTSTKAFGNTRASLRNRNSMICWLATFLDEGVQSTQLSTSAPRRASWQSGLEWEKGGQETKNEGHSRSEVVGRVRACPRLQKVCENLRKGMRDGHDERLVRVDVK